MRKCCPVKYFNIFVNAVGFYYLLFNLRNMFNRVMVEKSTSPPERFTNSSVHSRFTWHRPSP